jgi:hypothetical protein
MLKRRSVALKHLAGAILQALLEISAFNVAHTRPAEAVRADTIYLNEEKYQA